jgi:Na+/H+ antiporter NhaD/arsenite permease-like protein
MKIASWCRANAMPLIAVLTAAVTACFVPPDAAYAGYFDWKTLSCLFCVLAVVCALRSVGLFPVIARQLLQLFGTARSVGTALVLITLVGSMLLTNDTALLTFLPLSWMVLQEAGQEKLTAYVFILQNCAANLGGMLTPFGNPQNLYLFDHYHIPVGEFLSIMLLPFALSTGLILLCCLLIPRQVLAVPQRELTLDKPRAIAYGLLFCLAVGMVLRAVPYPVGLAVIAAALTVMDPRALKSVDWGLLVTFAAFFVFSGNMARIQPVRELFGRLLGHGVLPVSALTCQVISNVPAAILLSQFTDRFRELLIGVNIGGAGTLIASLASLITFREYTRRCPEQTGRFLVLFTLVSFGFLAILLAALSL